MALIAEPNTPDWFQRFVLRLKGQFVERGALVSQPSFQSTNLPDPVKFEGAVIYVTDDATLAFSNGIYWFPVLSGTHY